MSQVMTPEWLRRIFTRRRPVETKLAESSVEAAITAWENDPKKNPKGNKIVRGQDGQPVEIVLEKRGTKETFAIVVNGKKEERFDGENKTIGQAFGSLMFKQFLNEDVFNGWYELNGMQLLDAQVSRDNQGFVFGIPGPQPEVFETTMVGK